MNALLRKEIRLLGPSWLLALLVVLLLWVTPDWILFFRTGPSVAVLPMYLAAAMPFLVALNSMGRELSLGTFSGLMGLPTSRSRIWWTKALVLAVALLVLFALWWLACERLVTLERKILRTNSLWDSRVVWGGGLFWLAAYSGGLWTVLVFRQMAAALWFAVLAPVGLWTLVQEFFDRYRDGEAARNVVTTVVLLAYAAASFVWAWRMFLRAQDTQWTGGAVALPGWRTLFGDRERATETPVRKPRAWRALFGKELQLQQSQFLLASVLGLMHLALLGVRHWSGPAQNGTVMELLFRAFWGLWLVMPLLIGAASVADERKLGTLESAACLAVSRRSQFGIKLALVLVLGGLLGAFVPWLLEGNEGVIGVQQHIPNIPAWWTALSGLFILLGVATGIAFVAFYASTLARNTLQALGLAVTLIILTLVVGALGAAPENIFSIRLWRGPLFGYLAVVVFGAVLLALADWNFKRGHLGQRLWLRNSAGVFCAVVLVGLATTAIYHRVWERFLVREAMHGPAVFAQGEAVSTSASSYGTLSLTRSGGRLSFHRFVTSGSPLGYSRTFRLAGGAMDAGSNWLSAAYLWGQAAAVRADGTLWASERTSIPVRTADGFTWKNFPLVQVGDQTNWQQVAGTHVDRGMILVLSRDGRLWRWGKTPGKSPRETLLSEMEPVRVGEDADWAGLVPVTGQSTTVYLRKRDGSTWAINAWMRGSRRGQRELVPDVPIEPWPSFDGIRWRSLTGCFPFEVGVREDGTLWAMGRIPPLVQRSSQSGNWWAENASMQLGSEQDWKAVAGRDDTLLALKSDGSLWHWDFSVRSTPVRVGTQSDWVAVDTLMGALTALAADGSFWRWRDSSLYGSAGFELPLPYLGPSRVPQPVGKLLQNR
jgi:ABC-type transport system involved in multi-copper enzyme maturation permease subunit